MNDVFGCLKLVKPCGHIFHGLYWLSKFVPIYNKWLLIFPLAVTAGKVKKQKWGREKMNILHIISLSPAHTTYCSTWFPAVAVRPPSLALQLSENTSVPGHSSAGTRRNNNWKGNLMIIQCLVQLIQETHHRNASSIEISHTEATLSNWITLKDENKN